MTEEKNDTEESKDEKGIPSWILPILAALGSMGGSYMLWVKPLQDAFKALSEQIEELKAEIKELKKEKKKIRHEEFDGLENEEGENLLLQSRKNMSTQKPKYRKNIISIR